MRLPDIQNYKNDIETITRKIDEVDVCDRNYYLFNDKDKIKFIKTIEKIIRSSAEYKEYIKYLKETIDMTMCSFYTKIDSKNARKKISIEIHHEPFTLYDLCSIVLDKHMDERETLNPFHIAEEVMKLHYQNNVGLIPLSVTVHELVHSGRIFIPLQCIYGDFLKFLEEYKHYISNDLNNILQIKLQMSKDVNDTSILNKKYVYLEVDGFNLPQLLDINTLKT